MYSVNSIAFIFYLLLNICAEKLQPASGISNACVYNTRNTVCGQATSPRCHSLKKFLGRDGHLFTIAPPTVQLGNYDVHVYKLCEGEEAESITMDDVLRRGKLCPRSPVALSIAIGFTGCNNDFTINNNDFTVYEFINGSSNLDCHFKQRFLLVNTTEQRQGSCNSTSCPDSNSYCVSNNYKGCSFQCNCKTGYTSQGNTSGCTDIDECSLLEYTCGPHTYCVNIAGGYNCVCQTGYTESGNICEDIDECATLETPCGNNSDCVNTMGDYECLRRPSETSPPPMIVSTQPSLDPCEEDPEGCRESMESDLAESGKLFNGPPTAESVAVALDLVRRISDIPLTNDSDQLYLITNLVNNMVNFLTKFQEGGGSVPVNKSLVIVDVLDQVLTSAAIVVSSESADAGKGIVTSTEKYGQYLLDEVGDTLEEGYSITRNNIFLKAEKVLVNSEDFKFTSPNASVKLPPQFLSAYTDKAHVTVANTVISNLNKFFSANDSSQRPVSVILSSQILKDNNSYSTPLPEHPVVLEFEVGQDVKETKQMFLQCVFLDLSTSDWSTEGVETDTSEEGSVRCTSNHLTSFAVLLNIRGDVDVVNSKALQYVTMIGLIICLICLFMAIIFFLSLGKLLIHRVNYFVHLNLCISMFLAYGFFAFIDFATYKKVPCIIMASLLNYLFLALFCWMLCEGVLLYLLLVDVFSKLSRNKWFFLLLGWGPPAILFAVTYGIFHDDYVNPDYQVCWLASGKGHYTILMFAVPVAIIIVINTVFLVLVGRSLHRNMKRSKKLSKKHALQRISTEAKALVILLPLIGLSWVFGFIIVDNPDVTLTFAIVTTLLNLPQGFFLFFFHVVRSEKVWGRLQKKYGWFTRSKNPSSMSLSHYTSVRDRYQASMRKSSLKASPSHEKVPAGDVESGIGIEEEKSGVPELTPPPPSPTPPPPSPTPPPPSPTPPPPSPTPPPPSPTPPPPSPTPPPPTPSPSPPPYQLPKRPSITYSSTKYYRGNWSFS